MDSFLAISFLYFFYNNTNSTLCTSPDRTSFCDIDQFQPVCALSLTNDCGSLTSYCLLDFPNPCTACLDPNISGYILGDCSEAPLQTCPLNTMVQTNCDDTMKIEGVSVFGITEIEQIGGNSDIQRMLWDNECQACNKGESDYYFKGEETGQCMGIMTSNICRPEKYRLRVCPEYEDKACVFYTEGSNRCEEHVCKKTVSNRCEACHQEGAIFYLDGPCEANVE